MSWYNYNILHFFNLRLELLNQQMWLGDDVFSWETFLHQWPVWETIGSQWTLLTKYFYAWFIGFFKLTKWCRYMDLLFNGWTVIQNRLANRWRSTRLQYRHYGSLALSPCNVNVPFFGYYFGRCAPCLRTTPGSTIPVCYQLQTLIIVQSPCVHRIRMCWNGTSKSQTSTVNDQCMGSSCPPLITTAFELPADENSDWWLKVGHLMGNMIQCNPWTPPY